MKKVINIKDFKSIHFIGIGGIGMSALAKHLILSGKTVSGSDCSNFEQRLNLEKMGVKVSIGHFLNNIKSQDLVVYSSAISKDNQEYHTAIKLGKTILSRSEMLECVRSNFAQSIAVSGSHGKTTCTSMLTRVFDCAGKSPTAFIGGEDLVYSNYKQGHSGLMIFEACEYKKNILDFSPSVAVVLNIDNDHMESYGSLQNQIKTFQSFVDNRISVVNADDQNSKNLIGCNTVTFGIKEQAICRAEKIRRTLQGYSFSFVVRGVERGRIAVNLVGKHNIYNALASATVGEVFGLPFNVIKDGIEGFKGVKRRNEFIGVIKGAKAYADYCHHPTEITAYLNSLQQQDRWVVFQPHTYSRTKSLLNDFIKIFKKEQNVIIYKTYPARESYDYKGSAKFLFEEISKDFNGKNLLYANSKEQLKNLLRKGISAYQDKDMQGKIDKVLFLGAGDIYQISKEIIDQAK